MVRPAVPNQRIKSLFAGPVLRTLSVFLFGVLYGRWHANIGISDDFSYHQQPVASKLLLASNGQQQQKPSYSNGWHSIEVFYGNQAHLKELLPQNIEWFSQASQDEIVAKLFRHKRDGYFVDLAANDATVLSNTYSLEQHFGWKGLCIEPNPQYWANLTYRDCQVVAAIVGDKRMDEVHFRFDAGDHSGIAGQGFDNGPKFISRSQKKFTVPLKEILERFDAPKIIDYLSLDVEGAEGLIMANFPFNTYRIHIITVERPKQALLDLFEKTGFKFLKRLTKWGETLWAHESVMDQLDLKILDGFGPRSSNKTGKVL